jgi:hypothetical protein
MTTNIRECDHCKYKILVMDDDEKEKLCHKCKKGLLKIIETTK